MGVRINEHKKTMGAKLGHPSKMRRGQKKRNKTFVDI